MSLLSAWLILFIATELSHYGMAKTLWPRQGSPTRWILQSAWLSTSFLSVLLITGYAWLSALLTLSMVAVIWVVNQAKFNALQEPLVFSDFYLYLQIFTHPRLFLPFLNIPLTIITLSLSLGLLYFIIQWDNSIIQNHYDFMALLIALITSLVTSIVLARKQALSFEIIKDIQHNGLYNNLLIYSLAAKHASEKQRFSETLENNPYAALSLKKQKSSAGQHNPHIIVIQSESFFDARRLSDTIKTEVLKDFDQLCQQACCYGDLDVPCWGANTLRSEFSFLTGIANLTLSTYRYNPYHFLSSQPDFKNFVSFLKAKGYHCIAVHPNHKQFFKRDQVFPKLGFEKFLDITDFPNAVKAGPYISDSAVYNKITYLLENRLDKRPLFIFAITMENHGPLHLEKVPTDKHLDFYMQRPPDDYSDLTVYLSHLSNANQMAKSLTNYLSTTAQTSFCCWYGDHVPSMPKVYKALDYRYSATNYFIWSSSAAHRRSAQPQQAHLKIEELSLRLLQEAGLIND